MEVPLALELCEGRLIKLLNLYKTIMVHYTVGWLKDGAAVIAFLVLLFLVARHDIHKYKKVVIGLLLFGVLIDGVFTAYPPLHCYSLKLV